MRIMQFEWAIKVLESRLKAGEKLGENEEPKSDYDVFVNDGFEAAKIAVEAMKNICEYYYGYKGGYEKKDEHR